MNPILLTAGLALTGLTGAAAPAPTSDAPADSLRHRWTVGLQLSSQAYRMRYFRNSDAGNFDGFGPFMLTVGYQWRPRWAVEAGLTYWRNKTDFTATGTTIDGWPVTETTSGHSLRVAVPVRVRYTITDNAAHRVQFDALGGLGLAYTRGASTWTRTESGQETFRYESRSTGFGVSAALGAGARLGLGQRRRLEITADLLLHQSLLPWDGLGFSGNNFGPLGGWGLGLRYRL